MEIIYEDNHLIAVNKNCHEIVQGDRTGDRTLSDALKLYLKEKYNKRGNVFLGVIHRIDRPVTGIVIFARTGKALERMNDMFRNGEIKKTYWAIVENKPLEDEGELIHWLVRNEKQNKSYASDRKKPDSKKAILHYRLTGRSEKYFLLEIDLKTGRHHQIRCQFAKIGCPIKGDLKYGAKRSSNGGGISLHAGRVSFIHPVSKEPVNIVAPVPEDSLWKALKAECQYSNFPPPRNSRKSDVPGNSSSRI
jgi:23S rRNA pseudouridine1911/1915/1917 synthase